MGWCDHDSLLFLVPLVFVPHLRVDVESRGKTPFLFFVFVNLHHKSEEEGVCCCL